MLYLLSVKKSLEFDYPPPKAVALSRIHGFATEIFSRSFRRSHHYITTCWARGFLSYTKQMELSAVEFIRRFMLHILPENFYKIRYYGILSSRNKQQDTARCREILGVTEDKGTKKTKTPDTRPDKERLIDYGQCPNCRAGKMHFIKINIRAA